MPDWDVSRVTSMDSLFSSMRNPAITNLFNQDLSRWNTAAVTNTAYMFLMAGSFNGDISRWDTGSVTTMAGMFDGAATFNQDLSGWDVMAVTSNEEMWAGAAAMQDENKPCTPDGSSGDPDWRPC